MRKRARAVFLIIVRPFLQLWRHRGLELIPFVAISVILFLTRSFILEGLHAYIDSVQIKLDLTPEVQQRLEAFAGVIVDLVAIGAILPIVVLPLAFSGRFDLIASLRRLPRALGASIQALLLSFLSLRLYLVAVLGVTSITLCAEFLQAGMIEFCVAIILALCTYALLQLIISPFVAVLAIASADRKLELKNCSVFQRLQILTLIGIAVILTLFGAEISTAWPIWAALTLKLSTLWYGLALVGSALIIDPTDMG